MSSEITDLTDEQTTMRAYEKRVWEALNEHWRRRNNRRGLPSWASHTLNRTSTAIGSAATRVVDAVPEGVKEPMRRAGSVVSDKTARPAMEGAAALLELLNDWVLELNDPKNVERLARKKGATIDKFVELGDQDLKTCDRLLTGSSLAWRRTAGALEGGALGLLAMVPVAGLLGAMTADILVIQVLSTSIAARIAYSYGYDAKDTNEQIFIQRLVRRSFIAQAAKVEPLRETARAFSAAKDRVRWSEKLRTDHRVLVGVENLLKQFGPAGARVPIQNVAKALPMLGILIGAGMNSAVLGGVAADAKRYCQTRFLWDKYGLPLPAALTTGPDDNFGSEPIATF